MFVKNVKMINFKGIRRFEHKFELGKPTILIGKNGAGKTSTIQGFRFGLTGAAPSNPINEKANETLVSMEIEDETGEHPEFTLDRGIKRPNKGSVAILGKTTTGLSEKKFMEDTFGIDAKEMGLVMSSELLAQTKPSSLGELFLKHDKRVISTDDIKKIFLSDKSKSMVDITGGNDEKLPADFLEMFDSFVTTKDLNLSEITKIAGLAKEKRKNLKALYSEYSTKSKDFKSIVKPAYNEKELRDKLDEIKAVEKNIEMAKKVQKAYYDAVTAKENQEQQLAEFELQKMAVASAKKPDPEKYMKLKEDIEQGRDAISEKKSIVSTLKHNIKTMQVAEKKLDTKICPLSDKLVCSTDKTVLKEEIASTIKLNKESMEILEKQIDDDEKKLEMLIAEQTAYEKNKTAYEKLTMLELAIENIQKNPIKVPEKPEIPVKSSYEKEKQDLHDALEAIHTFNTCEADYKKALQLKRQVDLSDYIYKACDNGGIVKETFIKGSIDALEEICNERAYIFDPKMRVKFALKGGLTVTFDVNGINLPYDSLSTGEKITAILMLMDLLNCYLGSTILILDELNDLDAGNFKRLLSFVLDSRINEDYTNILLSCVNHADLEEIVNDYGSKLDVIKF